MAGEFRGNRGSAQSYIPALIEQEYSNSEIVDWLRENDLSYRTQNMYLDINRYRLENMGEAQITNLDRESPIPEKLMRNWYGDTEYQYRVVVKYEYFDNQTGTIRTTGTTLYYDEAPTQAQVLEDFEVRRETLQALYNNVDEVYSAVGVKYFKNLAPKG